MVVLIGFYDPSGPCSEYEEQIKTYAGDDPLELWLEYIHWIEQAFPRSGKESEFQQTLQRCLQLFEHEDKYKQDERMIKLYIKFVSTVCHLSVTLSYAVPALSDRFSAPDEPT